MKRFILALVAFGFIVVAGVVLLSTRDAFGNSVQTQPAIKYHAITTQAHGAALEAILNAQSAQGWKFVQMNGADIIFQR